MTEEERALMRQNRSTPLIQACIAEDEERVASLLAMKCRVDTSDVRLAKH